MPAFKKEFARLIKTQRLVNTHFARLGINKKQEVTRLLYETAKRENIEPAKALPRVYPRGFASLKRYLIRRRFPYAYLHDELTKPYLPKLELDPGNVCSVKQTEFSPRHIFIEQSADKSLLSQRFKKAFPQARFKTIPSLKAYQQQNPGLAPVDYNQRRDTLFIINEQYDFFKSCPCTQGALGCNYHIVNLGLGCIFECTYCYLQEYTNSPGIILPVNIDRFFSAFASYKKRGMRLGTGEFSDSLMLDHITEYSLPLIKFFGQHKDVTLEFKTKSNRIGNLLKANHKGNIVVSWSLNPQRIIDENEFLTASLKERLRAARQCVAAGYRVGFHFDPIFSFRGWEKEYGRVLEMLFNKIKPKHIAWISLGTFRFKPPLKKIIEARFPQNRILDEELLLGYDNKMRYPYSIRYNIYQSLLGMLRKHAKNLLVYLCMEEQTMWRDLKLASPF